jgi:hypothetical protein
MALDDSSSGRFGYELGIAPEIVDTLDVPEKIPMRARVIEFFEREVEPSEVPADPLEESSGSFETFDQRRSVQKGEDADPTGLTPAVLV